MSNPKEMEIDYESLKDYFEHEALIDIEEKYLEGGCDDNNEDEPMSDK